MTKKGPTLRTRPTQHIIIKPQDLMEKSNFKTTSRRKSGLLDQKLGVVNTSLLKIPQKWKPSRAVAL